MSSALVRVKKSLVFVIVLLSYFQSVVRDLAAYYKAFYIYKGFRFSSFLLHTVPGAIISLALNHVQYHSL